MKNLYSALIISSAIVFSNASIAGEKHYMSHNGDGPQGHMMEGKNHKAGMDNSHPMTSTSETKKTASTKEHYMPHSGDGSQGHTMKGEKHTTGTSTEHVEQYGEGKHAKQKGKHYMMETGDASQGHMMKGDKHPTK